VQVERIQLTAPAAARAAALRASVGAAPGATEEVRSGVAEIVAAVAERGDAALAELRARFDAPDAAARPARVPAEALARALVTLDPELRGALEVASANVDAVARAGLADDREVELPQGHSVRLREVPVRRAAIYAPGGRAPYPSTVVMGAVTARAAGVAEVVMVSPPGSDGDAHPVVLAAAALCGVDEVYRLGGAHAVAALALGTESIDAVDVIVGPGSPWVQEAKRQLCDRVGIDGFAGPSELLVVFGDDADPAPLALDLLAQAEHGDDSPVVAVSWSAAALDALAAELDRHEAPSAAGCLLVEVEDADEAIALADTYAPEHLQLAGAQAEARAGDITSAGCVFVGGAAATAFGDYVAGSNHVLPTGGAARFASALNVCHFRRRMSQVEIAPAAAAALAPAGIAIARAEGFAWHAESMAARIRDNGSR
jgi:histidinol dehydrogenase